MNNVPKPPVKIKPQAVANFLTDFIKNQVTTRGFKKAIVGLSGGVDSAVAAILTVKALGRKSVFFLILPYKKVNSQDVRDAVSLAKKLKVAYQVLDISPMVDQYCRLEKNISLIRKGNRMARERMCVLYDFSHKLKALVVGTGNRTEALMGYATLHGDLACAFLPLGGLFKTQVYELAQFLKVSPKILAKAPSAGLWKGQTDERELGISYEKLDKLLYLIYDQKKTFSEIIKNGYSRGLIKKIQARITANQFKLQLPTIAVLPKILLNSRMS